MCPRQPSRLLAAPNRKARRLIPIRLAPGPGGVQNDPSGSATMAVSSIRRQHLTAGACVGDRLGGITPRAGGRPERHVWVGVRAGGWGRVH